MFASLLRPRNPRWQSFYPYYPVMSAPGLPDAQETTPFLQNILRDDNSHASTEPFDWNGRLDRGNVDDEQGELVPDDDGVHGPLLPIFSSIHLDLIPVYTTTHAIRLLIEERCETTLTWDQLRSPQISQFLLKPIQQQIKDYHFDPCTLYALMANCLQFNKEAETNPGNSGTCHTRALVAELLAIKLLREYTTRELIDGLSYDFYPLQGQDPRLFLTPLHSSRNKQAMGHARISCLEIAIRAQAKRFIAHPLVVQHLEAIWAGTIVFHSIADNLHRPHLAASTAASRSHALYGSTNPVGTQHHNKRLAPPEYPRRTATLYDPHDASLFKLSRLRVPRYRQFLSTISFAVLLGLYLAVLAERSLHITTVEVIFWFWSAGFILDEIVGFNEQGFGLYLMSFWNLFDLGILLLLFCYAILRLYGMAVPDSDHLDAARQAYDILSASAILLFPRLFSVLDHYKYFSQLLIAFRIMAADLIAVFVLIIVACSGFLVAFSFSPDSSQSPPEIVYALFQILMGFTPTAWSIWEESNIIGRVILTLFLFICHFVVVTILITVLTNSFMAIVKNANEEHQFVFAINTISMVKSDALFSYIAPSNIIGWLVSPLRYCIPFRDFVKLNRTLIKMTHFPILWSIWFYEKTILCPRIIEPGDLIPGPGRSTTVLRARNKRLHRFNSFSRLTREPSIATHQQDRALEELFRTPYLQQPLQNTSESYHESHNRSRKSTMVNNWMQGMDAADLIPKFHPALRKMGSTLRRNYTETTRSAASDPEEFISYSNLRPVPENSVLYGPSAQLARHASHATDVEGDDEKSSDENNDDDSDLGQTSMEGSEIKTKKPEQTPRSSEKNGNKTPPKFFSSRPSTAIHNSRKNSPSRPRHHERNPSGITVLHRAPGNTDDSSDDSLPGPSSPLKRMEARRPVLPPRQEFMSVPNIHRIGSDMGEAGVLPSSLATQLPPDNEILGRLVLARMNNIEEGFREVLKEVKDMRGRSAHEPRPVFRNDIDDDIYP
ncbi:UPF0182 protein [Talaromyces islandicus]|uniref:UPF0182 protein n=1 Tax=Talaromyces islandicus TaxID=28573 RepID=A0A0U1LUW4_TALIS|nr:UPF0182 protein [Talaromyces islandicus]